MTFSIRSNGIPTHCGSSEAFFSYGKTRWFPMSMKRITISLDEKILSMLKNKQADMILEKNKAISVSSIIGYLLDNSLKTDESINSELDSIFTRIN